MNQVRLTEEESREVVSAYLRERTDLGVALPNTPRVEDIAEALHLTPAEVEHLLATVRRERADVAAREEQAAEERLERAEREARIAEAEARTARAKAEKAHAEADAKNAFYVAAHRHIGGATADMEILTPEQATARIAEIKRLEEERRAASRIHLTILAVFIVGLWWYLSVLMGP